MNHLIPHSYESFSVLNIFVWQWLGLSIVGGLSFLLSALSAYLLQRVLVNIIQRRSFLEPQSEFLESKFLGHPINLALFGWFFLVGLSTLSMSQKVLDVLIVAVKVFTYYGITFLLWRLTDIFNVYLVKKAEASATKFDDLLVPLISRSLKFSFLVLGAFSVAEILSLPLSSLLAGLGIGGLAIAMAAKDTIANVFGSLTIVLDRPFKIGDYVIIGDIEGSVEELGFRSTRIRTFYHSLVSIPNSNLLTSIVDNKGERRFRRIKTSLGVTYDTPPDKIEAFCEGIRDLIRSSESMKKDSYHVYFNGFGDFSLTILLICYIDTLDYGEELKIRHEFFKNILTLASSLGVEFAFPTQTLHIERES